MYETILRPYGANPAVKPLVIDPAIWHRALKISNRYGFSGGDLTGLTKNEVRPFLAALRKSDDPVIKMLADFVAEHCPSGLSVGRRIKKG